MTWHPPPSPERDCFLSRRFTSLPAILLLSALLPTYLLEPHPPLLGPPILTPSPRSSLLPTSSIMVQPGQTQPARGLFPFNPNGGYIPSISPAQFQVQPDLRHQPQNQPNPRFQPPSTQPPTPFGPSYLRDRWYASESVRTAATALHNRIYVPAAFSPDVRYDALFRPIITCAIDWSEVHGPFLTVRMWRWTGWFAPGETGLVVEKFLGRHGLRHPNNVSKSQRWKMSGLAADMSRKNQPVWLSSWSKSLPAYRCSNQA